MDRETIRVGQKLRAAIDKRGLSQKEVAAAHGVSQPRISRVLAGEFTKRSVLAERLCTEFEVEQLHAHKSEADRAFGSVTGSLMALWDGTPAGAKKLDALLEAVKSIRSAGS